MTFKFGSHDNVALRELLDLFAVSQSSPGAVGAAAVVAAIAARVGESGLTSNQDAAELFRRLSREVLSSADRDAEAYWNSTRTDEWKQATPVEVAHLASDISAMALGPLEGNQADFRAAAALGFGAAAATRVVAAANGGDDLPSSKPIMVAGADPSASAQLSIASANRCWLTDTSGDVWMDATSGLWNVPLGHGHPGPIASLIEQLTRVSAVNPFNTTTPGSERFAAKLMALVGVVDGQVLFGSSGSEVIEAALRLGLAATGPEEHISLWALPQAFHGSTAGAAGLSGFESVRYPFPGHLRMATSAPPATWSAPGLGFVEIFSGAAGCRMIAPHDLESVRNFQADGGFVVVDEIATGLGRAGWPTLSTEIGFEPDMLTLGKGLANGVVPVAALVISERVLTALESGIAVDFGHTHSNHPASIAAAAGCVEALLDIDHEAQAVMLRTSAERHGLVVEGRRSMLCVQGSPIPRAAALAALSRSRLLSHIPTVVDPVSQVILAPPLNLEVEEADEMCGRARHFQELVGW